MSDELESLKLSGKLENSENATRKSEEIKNRPIFFAQSEDFINQLGKSQMAADL